LNDDGSQLAHREVIERLLADQLDPDEVTDMAVRLERLCRAAAQHFSAVGVAIGLMAEDGATGYVSGADDVSARLGELEFTLGEGPSLDALTSCRPVLIADLNSSDGEAWPAYRSAVGALGVRGVFAFALHVGAATVGVFVIYTSEDSLMGHPELGVAVAFAETAIEIFLDGETVPSNGVLHPGVESVLTHRSEVYQAQGFVMVDLGISLDESLILLRVHALQHGLSLVAVSRLVLAGAIRLDSGGGLP